MTPLAALFLFIGFAGLELISICAASRGQTTAAAIGYLVSVIALVAMFLLLLRVIP